MLATMLIFAVAILLFALATWMLFMRKLAGLVFPAAADGSSLPFFTVQKLRIIAALHALTMIGICALLLLFLW
jgi:hypothetical protein